MLIEFRVTNYRSIRDTQTLSLVSSKYYNDLQDTNCFESGVVGLPSLLRSAVVYGPNASGKTNLLRALHYFRYFVIFSHAHQEGQTIDVVPFRLTGSTKEASSEFEIFFIQDNIRYQYGFAANRERVTKEWLIAYPKGRAQQWFEREYIPETDNYAWEFGNKFTGIKQIWQEATRKNALFLSTAIQLNNEQLKPVFNWFQQRLAIIPLKNTIAYSRMSNASIDMCTSEDGNKVISTLMNSADIGIAGIEVKKISPAEILSSGLPEDRKEKIMKDMGGRDVSVVRFQHRSDTGELISFDLSDESDGTQKLFALAAPWLDVLAFGHVLLIDELDTSLHPLMVRFLVSLIHNSETNKHNAQLIFTTHDTSLLDKDIFRRDQIWFMEKDSGSASKLYPLSDFSPRKDEALEKGYLHGRYGALPFIGEFKF